MDDDDLEFLQTVPSEILPERVTRGEISAKVQFKIRNAGRDPQVTIYWGSQEGLTFADRWGTPQADQIQGCDQQSFHNFRLAKKQAASDEVAPQKL